MYIIINLVLYTYINRVKIAQGKLSFLYKKIKKRKICTCRDLFVSKLLLTLEKNKELLRSLKADMRREAANVIKLIIITIELTIQL